MDRNDRNILILGILILVLLAVTYYFLLLSPLREEYLAKYDERTQKEGRKEQLERTAAALEKVRSNAPDYEHQILELSKRIPDQDELPSLLVQIEEVARAAKVTQFSLEPGSPEAPPGGGDFSRIPITMTFQGRYDQMQDFLLRIRNLARLVTVNKVTYCRYPDPLSDATCDVQIKEGGRETTGREATAVNGNAESVLKIQIEAEVYVQPAAGGETTSAGGAATTPSRGGAAKGGATTKGGGESTKGGGAAK